MESNFIVLLVKKNYKDTKVICHYRNRSRFIPKIQGLCENKKSGTLSQNEMNSALPKGSYSELKMSLILFIISVREYLLLTV